MPATPYTLQDMPPAQAHFCLGVERFLLRDAGAALAGAEVVCAFSGGVDSTVLLVALVALAPRLGCTVSAAHLDHGLRPESGAEADHAREFCARLGVPCAVEAVDVAALAGGTGLEEAAREARYAFLQRVRAERGAAFLALGHQLDDLAEDVLLRLVRGTGWPQLAGMRALDAERALLRPLLLTPRAQIEAFARALGLPWVEDASNRDPEAGRRNRMRLSVLPLLLAENPNFLESVAGLWRSARLDEDYFRNLGREALAASPEPGFLPRALLDGLHPALRLRLYKACLEELGPGQPLADGLRRLDAAFTSGEGGKTVQFPGDKQARVSGRGIRFVPGCGKDDEDGPSGH
ncbi:tRNA lysidine(34) synthetase TilS [Desulfocurvus sp. DL9XJH121]